MSSSQSGYPDDAIVNRTERTLSANIDDEAVLLEPDAGTYFGMNETGSLLWDRLDSTITVAELRTQLVDEYDIESETAHADLVAFLRELEESNLVEVERPDDAS